MGQSRTHRPLNNPQQFSNVRGSQRRNRYVLAATAVLGSSLIAPLKPSVAAASRTESPQATTLLAQAAPTESTYPTLTANSTGDSVSQVQATLKLLGFYQGTVDGTYTQTTQDAVARFQTAAGIPADGVTGPSTWRKLLPAPEEVGNAPVAATPTQPQTRTQTQEPAQTPAPIEPVPSGPPVLRPDAEGGAVAQLQRELQTLNYYDGEIDGGYGEQTQAAVMAFQRDQQLAVDAVVGPSTWDALSRELER